MKINKPIVLTEFPKSGGSWIVSLMGDSLGIAKRDIYVRPGFDLFEIKKHPWYGEHCELNFPISSVIKSHELPNSELIDFNADYIHLVRDGRDVVVSKWFFEKDFCVKNGLTSSFNKNFDDYVEEQALLWAEYISAWMKQGVLTVRYEDFLLNTKQELYKSIQLLFGVKLDQRTLEQAINKNTKEKFSESMNNVFEHNTFVRKGVSGDWKLHFSEKNIKTFNCIAGNALTTLRYEL